MADFRHKLYEGYVSSFKDAIPQDEQWLRRYWIWCEHKLLPHIERVQRDIPILDLGCGAGPMMGFLRKHGFSQVEGIDISEEQAQLALKQEHNVQVVDAFEFLESRQAVYGLIVALDFVEHFAKDELIQLFSVINQALMPGGTLLIQTPNGSGLFPHQIIYDDLTHLTIFTPESLSNILRVTGFDEIAFYETGPVPANYKGIIRILLWKMIKIVSNTIRYVETTKTQTIWTENLICRCRKLDN